MKQEHETKRDVSKLQRVLSFRKSIRNKQEKSEPGHYTRSDSRNTTISQQY